MNDRKDGGPAFPVTYMQSASPKDLQEMKAMARGISLRDYFAAKAMQGAVTVVVAERVLLKLVLHPMELARLQKCF